MLNVLRSNKSLTIVGISILSVVLVGVMLLNLNKGVMTMSCGIANQDAVYVSIINLIATPDKYDGKLVRVIGIGNIEFEGNGAYLSKKDFQNSITKNAVWLEPDYNKLKATPKDLEKLNGKVVIIEGIFNSSNNGHFGMYSGSIEKLTRYEKWNK